MIILPLLVCYGATFLPIFVFLVCCAPIEIRSVAAKIVVLFFR